MKKETIAVSQEQLVKTSPLMRNKEEDEFLNVLESFEKKETEDLLKHL